MTDTPGDWPTVTEPADGWLYRGPLGHGHWVTSADGTRQICVAYGIRQNPQHERDLRLIEAAPRLLNHCRAAMHALRSYQSGNYSSPDLAKALADDIAALLAEIDRG